MRELNPPILTRPFEFRLQFSVEWWLPCAFILWSIGILSSLLLSKTYESMSSRFVFTSSIHGSTLTIFCSTGQCNSTFVSVSLFPCGCVLNVNCLVVILIFAVLLRPSVARLRFSVRLILLPPDCNVASTAVQ